MRTERAIRLASEKRLGRGLACVALIVGLAGTAGALQIACGSDGSGRVSATSDSISAGASLYQANCTACHGADGRGGARAPDLAVHVPTRDDEFLFKRITAGFSSVSDPNTMPAYEDLLTEEERWHLVNFLSDEFGEIRPVLPTP